MKVKFKAIIRLLGCFALALAFSGCQSKKEAKVIWEDVEIPPSAESVQPYLLGQSEDLMMLWTEKMQNEKVVLSLGKYALGQWGSRKELVRGEDWFVNWADFPAVAQNGSHMIAHFLKKSDTATFSYDIHFVHSSSKGTNWSAPVKMHSDTVKTEHGFVSFSPLGEDSFQAVWLDGRNMEAGHHSMQLRSAEIGPDGQVLSEHLVDDKTCDCCQTSLVRTEKGALVAYRDRTDEEIRDIYVSAYREGEWSDPKAVFHDGWKINGCPVNGPKLSVFGNSIGLAWFTAANDEPRVKVSFSDDGGLNFQEPYLVDEGKPLGRVDIVMLNQNRALISWMEMSGEDAQLRLALIDKSKGKLTSMLVSEVSSKRSTGFPQLELAGGEVFMAWNLETSEGNIIKLVKTDLKQINP